MDTDWGQYEYDSTALPLRLSNTISNQNNRNQQDHSQIMEAQR